MNFQLSAEQQLMRDTFARFLNEHSSPARVRAALPSGFDRELWAGLAELGAFSLRVPEGAGGLGLGTLDAAVLMEEVGRTLASGPIAETLVATRMLSVTGPAAASPLLEQVIEGRAVLTLALHDIAEAPCQWVAGGAVADAVIARRGEQVVLITLLPSAQRGEPTLASTPLAELQLAEAPQTVIATTSAVFAQAIEEWKLLMAAALAGLSREAIRLAAAYACERSAFGQLIGTYQGISHPLADLSCDVDGGKYLAWKAIRDIADGLSEAGAEISLAVWWSTHTATRAVAQALHTFGGYGLTTDYDIHLYNLRAKAWPLVYGDPTRWLEEAGRRLYAGEAATLPEVGAVSIDFDLGPEARALAAEVDAFFKQTLTPELRAKAHYSFDGHDAGVHRKLAAARLLFPSWPKEYGGREAPPYSMSAVSHVWEEHGWTTHATSTSSMVGTIIRRFGSEELRREALTRIVNGEVICSLGYSEPRCGSDVFAAQTRATREPDGSWRIDGQKMFTSGANQAEYVLLLTRTNPDVAKHKGLTMFIVPLTAPGVMIQPVYTFQDERTNITYYDGVKVEDSYRLGEIDGGVKVMAASLELEHGGGFTKAQRALVREAVKLCREIRYRGRPLIEDTAAQTRLARATAHYFISEVLGWRALWASVQKMPNLGYGPMIKLFSSEKFLTDSADLLDLTAPYSLAKRSGPAGFLNQCYRHAQGTTIYGGTSEVHRSMIAERGLGLPRTRG
jgi:alkylation response protein AidB-like acyl-CoA dehydrogenase